MPRVFPTSEVMSQADVDRYLSKKRRLHAEQMNWLKPRNREGGIVNYSFSDVKAAEQKFLQPQESK